ncbi:hypothetical protein KRMM14A1259_71500 [Krasilnikovia sp. MM14-A1259]
MDLDQQLNAVKRQASRNHAGPFPGEGGDERVVLITLQAGDAEKENPSVQAQEPDEVPYRLNPTPKRSDRRHGDGSPNAGTRAPAQQNAR